MKNDPVGVMLEIKERNFYPAVASLVPVKLRYSWEFLSLRSLTILIKAPRVYDDASGGRKGWIPSLDFV